MLRLLLFRHAKSSWKEAGLADHQRPLSKRGQRDAPRMGRHMAQCGFVPELVLCSTAVRTRDTLDLALKAMRASPGRSHGPKVCFDERLYEAPPEVMLDCIGAAANDVTTLMVIGHNDGMAMLANMLATRGDAALRQRLAQKFPTAALAVLDFDCPTWADISKADGHLTAFTVPRELPSSA